VIFNPLKIPLDVYVSPVFFTPRPMRWPAVTLASACRTSRRRSLTRLSECDKVCVSNVNKEVAMRSEEKRMFMRRSRRVINS
jgi:hypothetical protein